MSAGKHILLVEDSPGECELFRRALDLTGLSISLWTEPTVDRAFSCLAETVKNGNGEAPSLILLDLKLCGRNGCELLRRLRSDARLIHVPVVMLTTSDDPDDIHTCYAAGASGYLVKPATFDELALMVHDLCRYWLHWNRTSLRMERSC
ncbi:MAG: response regulator [Nitrospiraceae bacterium]